MKKRRFPKKDGRPMALRTGRRKKRPKSEQKLQVADDLKVRSRPEKTCVEFLRKHNIDFQYEPLILLDGRQYRPDFYLPEYDLFIEICGYDHMPFYRDRIEQKRNIYGKHNLKAIFINPRSGGLVGNLKKELLASGIVRDK